MFRTFLHFQNQFFLLDMINAQIFMNVYLFIYYYSSQGYSIAYLTNLNDFPDFPEEWDWVPCHGISK